MRRFVDCASFGDWLLVWIWRSDRYFMLVYMARVCTPHLRLSPPLAASLTDLLAPLAYVPFGDA